MFLQTLDYFFQILQNSNIFDSFIREEKDISKFKEKLITSEEKKQIIGEDED